MPITDEQARYLPYDCIATWCLGQAVPFQAAEDIHTRGMVVLAHTSTNGLLVDPVVFRAMTDKLLEAKDRFRGELLLFGFPDPDRDPARDSAAARDGLYGSYFRFLRSLGLTSELEDGRELGAPRLLNLKYVILYMWNHDGERDERLLCASNVRAVFEWDRRTMRKHEKAMWDALCEERGLLALDECRREAAWHAYVGAMLAEYARQQESGESEASGFDFGRAQEAAEAVLDEHPEWMRRTETEGPKKFFQRHVAGLLSQNPGLELDRTEKSGDIKLTLKDMWRLSDLQIDDKFLKAYTGFKHCEKMLSTYLDPKWIKPDGRVRTRFTNVLRTGVSPFAA